jgi:hypothetical protein
MIGIMSYPQRVDLKFKSLKLFYAKFGSWDVRVYPGLEDLTTLFDKKKSKAMNTHVSV